MDNLLFSFSKFCLPLKLLTFWYSLLRLRIFLLIKLVIQGRSVRDHVIFEGKWNLDRRSILALKRSKENLCLNHPSAERLNSLNEFMSALN